LAFLQVVLGDGILRGIGQGRSEALLKKRLEKVYYKKVKMMDEKGLEQWERTNKTLEDIRDAMQAPKTLIEKILEYGGAAVGILGIMSIIDIVRNWILGG
jgi:hypothetical protein